MAGKASKAILHRSALFMHTCDRVVLIMSWIPSLYLCWQAVSFVILSLKMHPLINHIESTFAQDEEYVFEGNHDAIF